MAALQRTPPMLLNGNGPNPADCGALWSGQGS